jgi:hypothetical protein
MRAGIYARISREDVGNIDNTDIQVNEGVAYIARQEGWQHVATFVDDNISAYSDHTRRPDYERLLDCIRGNNLDVVVCTEPESTAPEFLTGLGGGWAGRRMLVCGLTASSERPCRLV